MDVCIVGGVPGRLHEGPVEAGGHHFHVTRHQFKRFADFTTPARDTVTVDEAALQAFVSAVGAFDAVICESPEALVLTAEWRRRGERPRAVIAMEIQRLRRVNALRRWYTAARGEDPWPATAAAPWITWHVMHPALAPPLREAGVPAERILHIPTSTALLRMLLPDAEALFDGHPPAEPTDAAPDTALPRDTVLAPGSGDRDRETLLRAAATLPDVPFTIVDEHVARHRDRLARAGLWGLANVTFLAPVPLERYVALVRQAAIIVVPLTGEGGGGHTTVTLAQRLGRPVVTTDVAAIAGYVAPGRTGVLVPPDDAAALAEALRTLWDDPAARARLGAAARAEEQERARTTWARVEQALGLAQAGAAAFEGW